MSKFQSYGSILKPYCAISGLYALLLTGLKLIEYWLYGLDAPNRLQLLGNAILYNLLVTAWIFFGLGLAYLLLRFLSERFAKGFAAVFYSLLLLAEIGLTIYALHNGYLLGSELIARPFSETLLAIRGAVGTVLPIVLAVAVIGGFTALALWRSKKPSGASLAVFPIAILLILLSLIFEVSHLVPVRYSYFILNKTHYTVGDCYDYLRSEKHEEFQGDDAYLKYDETLMGELLSSHPEWTGTIDLLYPLERPERVDDFLSPHFDTCSTTPNLVIILVESLGAEVINSGAMPFIDSLASTGLYWPNCISTTVRSYGAVPAITGSVGGPKSFQFGTMPAHNSLLSLLKHEGYNTRAYYTGQFTFDCIYDYLTAQDIDYLSPFFEELTKAGDQNDYWWGYQDDKLFQGTLENLSTLDGSQPFCALIITLTMHDVLSLADDRQQEYEQRAKLLPPSPPGSNLDALYSACLFTDDHLRRFFQAFRQRDDFDHTLFIITGDHSSGRQRGDKLSLHHVPLVVWSPLVKQPERFSHPVTHNDIAPSLYQLLTHRYGVKAQPTVHWLGDGLGPDPKTLLIVNYSHEIHDIIFHNHYYQSPSRFEPEALYSFGDDLTLHSCDDSRDLDMCRQQLMLMRYLYDYTYRCNRLTAHPLNTKQYTTVRTYQPAGDIECRTPDAPPSQVGNATYVVLPSTLLKDTEGHTTMRLTLEADVIIHDSIAQSSYPNLRFLFEGEQHLDEYDRLSKFLTGEAVGLTGTCHISLAKEFPLSATRQNNIIVELCTPIYDKDHRPGSRITLSNTLITIDYDR